MGYTRLNDSDFDSDDAADLQGVDDDSEDNNPTETPEATNADIAKSIHALAKKNYDSSDKIATAFTNLANAMQGSNGDQGDNLSQRLDALETRLNSQDSKLDSILSAIRGD